MKALFYVPEAEWGWLLCCPLCRLCTWPVTGLFPYWLHGQRMLIILEPEIRASSDEVIIMTDDGSYGQKGLVTPGMEEIINQRENRYGIDNWPGHYDEIYKSAYS